MPFLTKEKNNLLHPSKVFRIEISSYVEHAVKKETIDQFFF
jgi:hypothetical protein